MFGDAEYYIRDDGWRYSVAKFLGGKWPVGEYEVREDKFGLTCTCAGYHGRFTCRHTVIVEEWKRLGKPWMKCFNEFGSPT